MTFYRIYIYSLEVKKLNKKKLKCSNNKNSLD